MLYDDRPPGPDWIKSSSAGHGLPCIEVAALPDGGVALRYSRDPATVLRFTAAEWAAFLDGAKAGEFDSLAGG